MGPKASAAGKMETPTWAVLCWAAAWSRTNAVYCLTFFTQSFMSLVHIRYTLHLIKPPSFKKIFFKSAGEMVQMIKASLPTKMSKNWIMFLFIYCVCGVCRSDIEHTWRPERTTWRSWFSPFTMWLPGIELKFSGLAAGDSTCWAISLALPSLCVTVLLKARPLRSISRQAFPSLVGRCHAALYGFALSLKFLNNSREV